jgi:hypothetical protein
MMRCLAIAFIVIVLPNSFAVAQSRPYRPDPSAKQPSIDVR